MRNILIDGNALYELTNHQVKIHALIYAQLP